MSTQGVYINGEELSRLAGLPDIQFRLYVVARQFMDWSTGIVGLKRGVSWQSLREELYIEPAPGIKGGAPSKDQVRRAADGLMRAGLIQFSKKNGESFSLVFKCLLASVDNSVQNKAAIKPPLLPATPEAAPLLAESEKAATPEQAKAATPPSVLDIYIPPPPKQDRDIPEVGGVGVEYSKIIKPQSIQAIETYLKAANPADHQALIDDLAGNLSQASGKGLPVANQAGYFRRIMERYKAGDWAPELAHIGAAMRQREQQAQAAQHEREKAPPVKPQEKRRSQPPDSFKAALAMLGVKS